MTFRDIITNNASYYCNSHALKNSDVPYSIDLNSKLRNIVVEAKNYKNFTSKGV